METSDWVCDIGGVVPQSGAPACGDNEYDGVVAPRALAHGATSTEAAAGAPAGARAMVTASLVDICHQPMARAEGWHCGFDFDLLKERSGAAVGSAGGVPRPMAPRSAPPAAAP